MTVLSSYEGVNTMVCAEEGCEQEAMGCYLAWGDDGTPDSDEPDEWLCPEHAHKAGYCSGCGYFWAGVSSFDFSRTGLCENCQCEVDADETVYEDDCWPFYKDFRYTSEYQEMEGED